MEKPLTIADYHGEFFKVLATTKASQVAVMTLEPGKDSGPEDLHPGDQIIYVVAGFAEVKMKENVISVDQGQLFIIPPQTKHRIYNRTDETLFILNIYAPPAY